MSLSTAIEPYERSKAEDAPTVPVVDRWFGSWRVSLHRRAYSAAELKETYDDKAAGWRRIIDQFGVERAYADAIERIRLRGEFSLGASRGSVLDCGAGDGAFAAAVAKTFSAQVTAVDISPEMLACAKTRLDALGIRADYQVANACSLPFPDKSFDSVVTAHMLEHLPDPKRALSEIKRVLKPGGTVIASITRRSLLGRWIQLTWRTHAVGRQDGERLLNDAGFGGVWSLPSTGHRLFDRLSIIYVGRKPLV
ncbi:MAG: class I SAM-dependent methyltransferase [Pseudomonadota bacterium]